MGTVPHCKWRTYVTYSHYVCYITLSQRAIHDPRFFVVFKRISTQLNHLTYSATKVGNSRSRCKIQFVPSPRPMMCTLSESYCLVWCTWMCVCAMSVRVRQIKMKGKNKKNADRKLHNSFWNKVNNSIIFCTATSTKDSRVIVYCRVAKTLPRPSYLYRQAATLIEPKS